MNNHCNKTSGGTLSALTCCVNMRLLSGDKKKSILKVGLGAGSILRKL